MDLGSGAGFDALIGCVAGAETEEVYVRHIRDAGFVDIELERRPAGEMFDLAANDPVINAAIAEFGVERARAQRSPFNSVR